MHISFSETIKNAKIFTALLNDFLSQLNTSTTVEFVKVLDAMGQIKRKLTRAVLKDTVTVPDGGYTIIRFKATNPG